MSLEGNGLHSREAIAGYDRKGMEEGVIVLVGCGAAGCNIAQTLALSGVGELRLVDPDVVELSNVTRSPLFRRERLASGRERHKVREVALGVLALSTAASPRVRFAVRPIEALGYGALRGASVVISALDSLSGRAYLADLTRALGVPLVELGFQGHEGHVAVFPNAADDEPCWRCMHPRVADGRLSCREYARAVVARGMTPATQPLAATFSALAAEAAIGALHGRFDLGGRYLGLDIRSGRAHRLEIALEPQCPGVHRRLRPDASVPVTARQPLTTLFEAVRSLVSEPVIHLPAEYVVSAPCVACGSEVPVGRPAWMMKEAPRCRRGCAPRPRLGGSGVLAVTTLRAQDDLATHTCLALGCAPGTLVTIEDVVTHASVVVELAGDLDDLYTLRMREDGSAGDGVPAPVATAPAERDEVAAE